MSSGVIYVAFGDRFTAEAIRSARSLKAHSELPITLFTDRAVDDSAIDDVVRFDPSHKRAKVDLISRSPYERTLYLDSDTLVLRDLGDAFGVLDRFDVAAVHDHSRKSSRWARIIAEYADIPYAFPEFNSGVIFFRQNDATKDLFERWSQNFYKFRELTRGLDQASFRVSLWQSKVSVHSLPSEYNVRNQQIRNRMSRRSSQPDDESLLKPRILHWHGLERRGLPWSVLPKYRAMKY